MKKIVNMAICAALTVSMLTGCGAVSAHSQNSSVQTSGDLVPVNTVATGEFDKSLMEFVENAGYSDKSYMVSPTSFRAALALAVAGADTETKEELIHAMGFNDMEEVNAWYESVVKMVDDFNKDLDSDVKRFKADREYFGEDASAPEGKLTMLNSIWNNKDKNGKFGKKYKKYVKDNYSAEANDVSSKDITEKVDEWINKGTNGLIPSLEADLSNANAVLVNTLYLKSSWVNSFEEYMTETGTFTTAKGEKVEKDFMSQTEYFQYYEDKNGKLVVLPLNGGVNAIFILGEVGDVHEAIKKASSENVYVKIPKFDVESSFDENQFIDFLVDRGAELAFTVDADFSVMCPDTSWMISDIIQKTRVKIDEDGLEAAAATAIMMLESAMEVTEEPKEFIADQPFKFYICGGEDNTEVLFCGQIAE